MTVFQPPPSFLLFSAASAIDISLFRLFLSDYRRGPLYQMHTPFCFAALLPELIFH
jgi:hypothetical protein